MSAPILWILVPLGVAAVLTALQSLPRLSGWIATVFAALLAALAFVFPDDLVLQIGSFQLTLEPAVTLFGRVIQIEAGNLALVGLLYTVSFLWNLLGNPQTISRWFRPLSFVIVPLWVATLAIEPFLYAAVLVVLIALTSLPLLSPRGTRTQPGILRYLIFQVLALPLILLSSWMVSGLETAPSATPLIVRAAVLVIFGFAFWLAIIPFHTWVPAMTVESPQWSVSFLLTLMQTSLVILLLYFLDSFAWLRNLPQLFPMLRWAGALAIMLAGIMAAFQNNVKRVMAYVYIAETGYSLLAIGLTHQGGLPYLAMMLLPRAAGYLFAGFTLSSLFEIKPGYDGGFAGLHELYRRYPFISGGLLFSLMSLLGMPLFALFPVKRMLWNILPASFPALVPVISIGLLGFLLILLRLLHVITTPDSTAPCAPAAGLSILEKPATAAILIGLLLLTLFIGLLPHLILTPLQHILDPIINLIPAL